MSDPRDQDVTVILEAVRAGDESAADRLFVVVYDELRKLAHARMRAERVGSTLQTTALVNEAYLKLVGAEQRGGWENRRHFFGAAARAMRQILVDRARRRNAERRGGGEAPVALDDTPPGAAANEVSVDVIALDEALHSLGKSRPELGDVVHLRYFLGLTVPETAELLGVSPRKVDKDWMLAKAWLRREMDHGSPRAEGRRDDA